MTSHGESQSAALGARAVRAVRVALAALAITLPAGVAAQSGATAALAGCVQDPAGRPVASARVWIEGRSDTLTTDAEGRFGVPGVPVGEHIVRIRKLGFRPVRVPVIVSGDDRACRPFSLEPSPNELDTVEVTGRAARIDQSNLRGFYGRMDSKMYPINSFLTAAEGEKIAASQTSDWLRVMQGVKVVSSGRRGEVIRNQVRVRGGIGAGNLCVPFVYVDGLLFDRNGQVDDIAPQSVAAIEVHGGLAKTPPEFQSGANQCGVVLIWSKTR
jgi:hypothetical protein